MNIESFHESHFRGSISLTNQHAAQVEVACKVWDESVRQTTTPSDESSLKVLLYVLMNPETDQYLSMQDSICSSL